MEETKSINIRELRELATAIYNNLETRKRTEGAEFVTWKEETPEELRLWFRELNIGDSFGDLDEKYSIASEIAGLVLDSTNGDDPETTREQLDDEITEHEWLDIYNADRLQWLMDDLRREVIANQYLADSGGIYDAIGYAQDEVRRGFASEILDAMLERISK